MRLRSPHPVHQATTAHACAAYPFLAEAGVWAPGAYIGRDYFGGGGAFCYDPWELYARHLLTGPNGCVIGMVGRGKSALVKCYCFRQLAFGRRVLMLDPKGENGPLCAACGGISIRLEPGGAVRLNPLDARIGDPSRSGRDVRGDRLATLYAVIGAVLWRPLDPAEKAAARVALEMATRAAAARGAEPTLKDVALAMFTPDETAAQTFSLTGCELAHASREAAMALDELLDGPLAGMFDGETTPGLRFDAPLVSFDLSAVFRSEALGVLMVCAGAWMQQLLTRNAARGIRTIVVNDEAWACLRNLELARWLQSNFKLARAYGCQNLVVVHRFSDLLAAGSSGSESVAIAQGLLSDSETQVIYAQPAAEIERTRELLALTDTEADEIRRLPKGRALWRVGLRSFVVDHVMAPTETVICDTDIAMTGIPREFGDSEGSPYEDLADVAASSNGHAAGVPVGAELVEVRPPANAGRTSG